MINIDISSPVVARKSLSHLLGISEDLVIQNKLYIPEQSLSICNSGRIDAVIKNATIRGFHYSTINSNYPESFHYGIENLLNMLDNQNSSLSQFLHNKDIYVDITQMKILTKEGSFDIVKECSIGQKSSRADAC